MEQKLIRQKLIDLTLDRIRFLKREKNFNGTSLSHSKDHVLNYPEICHFYAKDVVDIGYKSIPAHLNKNLEKYGIIKMHKGGGTIAHYRFNDDVLRRLVERVYSEK